MGILTYLFSCWVYATVLFHRDLLTETPVEKSHPLLEIPPRNL